MRACAPLAGEELLARRVVAGRDFGAAVDFERQRRAVDRKAMGVVGGAVERIEDPAEARGPAPGRRSAQLLREDVVLRESFSDRVAAHPLAGEIDLRDQVDASLFVHAKAGLLPLALDVAGAQ